MKVNDWNKNKALESWHILQNKKTGVCDSYYYDEGDYNQDTWKDEFGEDRNDYNEIPCEDWSAAQISEILANCMEDCNMHRSLYWPEIILKAVSGLDDNIQKEIMQHVMNEMLEHHLY